MATNPKGYIGEWLSEQYIHNIGHRCLQLDWLSWSEEDQQYVAYEAKNKKLWTATLPSGASFQGVGIPIHQVEARLLLQKRTGIRTKVIHTNITIADTFGKKFVPVTFNYAWLDELDASGDYVYIKSPSNGGGPGRAYNIALFSSRVINVNAEKLRQKFQDCS